MTDKDHATVERMQRFGGSFAASLANACYLADAQNLEIIKRAFPEIFSKYGEDGIFADK